MPIGSEEGYVVAMDEERKGREGDHRESSGGAMRNSMAVTVLNDMISTLFEGRICNR